MEILDLSQNQISYINMSNFAGCFNLLELNLGLNSIANIDSLSFVDLTCLKKLTLSFNQIGNFLDPFDAKYFGLSSSLEELHLRNTWFYFSSSSFKYLSNLIILDISLNGITIFFPQTFQNLSNLLNLNIQI